MVYLLSTRLEEHREAVKSLPDYLREGLEIVSIGLNPSINSVRSGFYFATPRNRFWRALNASGLVARPLEPGPEAVQTLFDSCSMGFTDLVKKPTRRGSELRAADYRRWAPVLRDKLLRYAPRIAWFHGKVAYAHYLRSAGEDGEPGAWGLQPLGIGPAAVFVTPNPSPANAAFSLAELIGWYDALAVLRDSRSR